jgi:hypothetical protein
MPLSFSVTWDYRCPFARNVHDHIVEALEGGADWDVGFVPFSLGQVHVDEGETDIWDRPGDDSGLLALQAGVVVREQVPDRFLAAHRQLFDARHLHGRLLQDPEVVRAALTAAEVDAGAVLDEVATGSALETIRKEHERAVADHEVWGVPTFIAGEQAVFVRLMHPADRSDPAPSRQSIERIVALMTGWPELNEFKHTSVRR